MCMPVTLYPAPAPECDTCHGCCIGSCLTSALASSASEGSTSSKVKLSAALPSGRSATPLSPFCMPQVSQQQFKLCYNQAVPVWRSGLRTKRDRCPCLHRTRRRSQRLSSPRARLLIEYGKKSAPKARRSRRGAPGVRSWLCGKPNRLAVTCNREAVQASGGKCGVQRGLSHATTRTIHSLRRHKLPLSAVTVLAWRPEGDPHHDSARHVLCVSGVPECVRQSDQHIAVHFSGRMFAGPQKTLGHTSRPS